MSHFNSKSRCQLRRLCRSKPLLSNDNKLVNVWWSDPTTTTTKSDLILSIDEPYNIVNNNNNNNNNHQHHLISSLSQHKFCKSKQSVNRSNPFNRLFYLSIIFLCFANIHEFLPNVLAQRPHNIGK